MKLTFYPLLLFFCCPLFYLTAQSAADFEFSAIHKTQYNPVLDVLPLKSGNTLVVKGRRKGVNMLMSQPQPATSFELRDKNLNIEKAVDLNYFFSGVSDDREKEFRHAEVLEDKTIIFYTVKESRLSFSLFVAELDEDKLLLSSKERFIGRFEKTFPKAEERMQIVTSSNREYIACFFGSLESELRKTNQLNLVVLDNTLDKVWETRTTDDFVDYQKNGYENIVINNQGEVFTLEVLKNYQLSLGNDEKEKYVYSINKFDVEGEESIRKELKSIDHNTRNLILSLNQAGELLITGFYSSNEAGKKDTGGLVYYSFDSERLEAIHSNIQPLDQEFIEDGDSGLMNFISMNFNSAKMLDKYLKIRGLIHLKGGTTVLIAEKHRESFTPSDDAKGNYFAHNLRDIILIKFEADGTVAWTKKVVKNQFYKHYVRESPYNVGCLGFASFTFATKGDQILLFYNDHPANIELAESLNELKPCPYTLKSSFCAVTVDLDGSMKKHVLFSSREKKLIMNPAFSKSLDGEREEVILLSRYGRNESFIRFR